MRRALYKVLLFLTGLLDHGGASRNVAGRERLEAAPTFAPDWTPEHQSLLKQYLQSPSGQVLIARGRAIQFRSANNACADVFHTQHSAGIAKGFGDCLTWLESLALINFPAATADSVANDTPPIGEPELRELLSP